MRTIGGLVDYLLVVAVQSFMLLQVGFFDAIRRLLGRLRPPPPLHSPAAALPPLRTVSVVLPTYNEERSIRHCLDALHHGAASLDDVEVIVVDGGCRDRTMDLVAEWSAAHPRLRLLRETSHGGRGPAVRAGVRHATGDAVLVLHADTALPALWDALLLRSLSDRAVLMTAFSFQCDRAQLAEAHSPPAGLALMEWTVNLRSRWYELPFGDQALATTRATLDALGGYPPTCILEEYMLVNQVRRLTAGGAARIATLDAAALCSPRRWERGKVWRVNAINQAVMLWHKLGATPAQIFSFYYGVPAPDAHAPAEWDPLSRCVNGRRRAVFVHVPRCAGTSLEAAIFAQDHYSQHLTAAELRALLGPRAYDGAFRFAFVRDPLDRFLSAFYYLLFRGLTQSAAAAVSPHDLLAAEMLRRDFGADPLLFLLHLQRLEGHWARVPIHFRPQACFLPADGAAGALHFVGRFEALEAEYGRLLRAEPRLARHAQPRLGHHRRAIPPQSGQDASREAEARAAWEQSAELRSLVREVYAKDYALLERLLLEDQGQG